VSSTPDIRLLVLDVDGVLTDGKLIFDDSGNQLKVFSVLDGSAIKLWQRLGGDVALLSGRQSEAVSRRAAELGIEAVEQGHDAKIEPFERILAHFELVAEACCYVGDDWPDIGPMQRCGYPVAVANAAEEVKQAAAYVTSRSGGDGAVREVIVHLLRRQGRWNAALGDIMGSAGGKVTH
jgi:3-deoxy-D-manno-octulosonate 8-phosphate phosphatase (KDO 8-P phosphatase)